MENNDYIDRCISYFIDSADRQKVFGCSYVQRICRISYNQAQQVILGLKEKGVIQKDGEYSFVFCDAQ